MSALSEAALRDIVALRRDLHAHPELAFDVGRTAGIIADRLRAFGCDEVVTGIGKTGVVGIIRGKTNTTKRIVGLRADMDALPIEEQTNLLHSSKIEGKMHACGHDGHSAMLVGAAQALTASRDFDGTAVLVFQPAEEIGGGALAMIEDGLFERFGIQEIYGMHTRPGLPIGQFALCPGSAMCAADRFEVTIEGRGGHSARPNRSIDPVIVATQIIMALQTIVSRNTDPLESAVLSVCAIHGGEAFNVIPQSVTFRGTVRTLKPEIHALCEKRFREIVTGIAASFGASVTIDYEHSCPITYNDPAKTVLAGDAAALVVGESRIERDAAPSLGSEDFSYMLEKRPGAFISIGNGDSGNLHHPMFDFDDAAIPHGVAYWKQLVETLMRPTA